jgi:hypothetical protein
MGYEYEPLLKEILAELVKLNERLNEIGKFVNHPQYAVMPYVVPQIKSTEEPDLNPFKLTCKL